jgi:hypothetical protein
MRINLKLFRGSLILFSVALVLAFLLTGSKAGQKKITIVFTGGLFNIFHPFGEDPEQSENLKYLDRILCRLKKSYPEALFVDTGNYVNAPDYVETMYSTPGMVHFRKHGYDAINIGFREILFGTSVVNPEENKNPPPLVTSYLDAKTNAPLAEPYIDFDIPRMPRIRVLGTGRLDCAFSAPALRNVIKEPDLPAALSSHLKTFPEPSLTLLLSDLPHSENIALAGVLPDLDLILESEINPLEPLIKEKKTYLCRKTEQKSIGVVHVKVNDQGKISKIDFKSYPLRGKEGFLFFKKNKIPPSIKPPRPHLGNIESAERSLERLRVPHKAYVISRTNAGRFSHLVASPRVFYYDLFEKQNHFARTFYVEHSLGERLPELMFYVTLDLENRIKKVDITLIPSLAGWDPDFEGFVNSCIGKKWNEMEFDPRGCGGALEVFHSMYLDISLVSQMADELIEKK